MKIIGKTENGYIVEASEDDVAAIEGRYVHEKRYEIGDIIDIYGLFRKYNTVSMALKDINNLRLCANNIIDATNWIEKYSNK